MAAYTGLPLSRSSSWRLIHRSRTSFGTLCLTHFEPTERLRFCSTTDRRRCSSSLSMRQYREPNAASGSAASIAGGIGVGPRETQNSNLVDMKSPEVGEAEGRSGRNSLCAQVAGSECPSSYDATLGVLSNREMVTGRYVLAREADPKCVTVGLPIMVRVERSRLSALVEVATARERRFKLEMTGEALMASDSRAKSEKTGAALMARDSRPKSETNGEVLMERESRPKSEMIGEASIERESRARSDTIGEASMVRDSRARSETIGEALMARESRVKSETLEDSGRAVTKLGQSSGVANCSVSPVESSALRVQPRGPRSLSRAARRSLNSCGGRRAGGTSQSHCSPDRGATVMGIANRVRMRATTGWAARMTLIGRGMRIGVSSQDRIEPRGGVYGEMERRSRSAN